MEQHDAPEPQAPDVTPDYENAPEGFSLSTQPDGTFEIDYANRGMGCMKIFFIVWLTMWTFGLGAMLMDFIQSWKMEMLPLILPFSIAEVVVLGLLLWFQFGRTRLILSETELVRERSLFGYGWAKRIPRATVREVAQIKDGGEDDDSFPSWGLELQGEESLTVISRQSIGVSDWLGPILAEWANCPYAPCTKRS